MKKTFIAIAVVAMALVATTFYSISTQSSQPTTPQLATEQKPSQANLIKFSNSGKTVDYDGVPGQPALETLRSLTTVGTKSSSYGDMIISINGLAADNTSEFWGFYVNGKLANEGAGTFKATNGDKIEWRLEKL
jgi:hypothetical protein